MRGIQRRFERLFHSRRKFLLLAAAVLEGIGLVSGGAYAALGGATRPMAAATDVELGRGLIGHWKFNGNAKDSTPNANNGTVNGASLAADDKGVNDNAYTFNGTSSYILVNNAPAFNFGTGDFAFNVRFKINSTSPGAQKLLHKYNGSNVGYELQVNPGRELRYSVNTGGTSSAAGTIAVGAWYDVAILRTGSTLRLYVNGSLVNSGTSSTTINNTTALSIGRNGGGGEYCNCTISDIRGYNRALNTAEIQALQDVYNPEIRVGGGQGGLTGHWKMDGNPKDSTPNGNNGTVNAVTVTTDRKDRANSAYAFNGTNADLRAFPQAAAPVGARTICAWFLMNSTGTQQTIFSNRADPNGFFIRLNGPGPGYISYSHVAKADLHVNAGLAAGAWHHMCATYNGSTTASIFLNGAVAGTQGSFTADTASAVNGYIGSESPGTRVLNGKLDDVRMYNRVLSAEEIKRQYESYDSQINLNSSPGSTTAAGNINAGLIGYWPFNGNSRDATPQGNNAIPGAGSPSLTTDRTARTNSAYNFTASSSNYFGVLDADIHSPVALTATAWVNWTGVTNNNNIVAKSQNLEYRYRILNTGAVQVLYFGSGSLKTLSTAAGAVPANTWTMVSFTASPSGVAIYINGQLSTSNNVPYSGTNTSGSLYIGSLSNVAEYFSGKIDEVRLYDRVLSTTELQMLYSRAD